MVQRTLTVAVAGLTTLLTACGGGEDQLRLPADIALPGAVENRLGGPVHHGDRMLFDGDDAACAAYLEEFGVEWERSTRDDEGREIVVLRRGGDVVEVLCAYGIIAVSPAEQ